MAIRRVLKMGHPLLRQVAQPLRPGDISAPELQALLKDMQDTLADYGGIGLAAPQIGESIRLAIINIPEGQSRYGELDAMPLTTFINPAIEVLNPATEGYWEGCLSVPGLRGFVARPQHVRIDYLDVHAQEQQLELRGFPATVFQHEFDHLDGILFIDRVADMSRLSFEAEFERFHQ